MSELKNYILGNPVVGDSNITAKEELLSPVCGNEFHYVDNENVLSCEQNKKDFAAFTNPNPTFGGINEISKDCGNYKGDTIKDYGDFVAAMDYNTFGPSCGGKY